VSILFDFEKLQLHLKSKNKEGKWICLNIKNGKANEKKEGTKK
jgi:hypothetical protein